MIREVIHVNINVTNIERSLAFYQKLGFEVMHVFGDKAGGEGDRFIVDVDRHARIIRQRKPADQQPGPATPNRPG